MPPRERPPKRTPRGVIYRRRLLAVAVLAAGFAAAWFAVASIGGGNGGRRETTTVALPPKPFRVVFPEGFTRAQMAARVEAVAKIAKHERGKAPKLTARGYLEATSHKRLQPGFGDRHYPLEGFLFPATYDFTRKTTEAQLETEQLNAFRRNWAKVSLRYARSKNLTPYDVLTIASMIEREAAVPEERALVSAVIYNRLHRHMALGIDATLRYGLNIPPTQAIRESQLASRSPYNTSKRPGLPPTPIANPGLASIQAAAHPAHVDYLYYVRKPDKKHHFFTASYSAFERYKAAHGYK